MANEAITNATAWTLSSWGMLVHPAGAGDTTPPGPVADLMLASRAAASLTLSFTVPTDADFSIVELYAFALEGGVDGTATGAASPVTVAGLTAGQAYSVVAMAKDAAGNRSTPVVLEPTARTMNEATPDNPMHVYWYTDRRATANSQCPKAIDTTVVGRQGVRNVGLNASGRVLRLRGVLRHPVERFEILELGVTALVMRRKPHGLRET